MPKNSRRHNFRRLSTNGGSLSLALNALGERVANIQKSAQAEELRITNDQLLREKMDAQSALQQAMEELQRLQARVGDIERANASALREVQEAVKLEHSTAVAEMLKLREEVASATMRSRQLDGHFAELQDTSAKLAQEKANMEKDIADSLAREKENTEAQKALDQAVLELQEALRRQQEAEDSHRHDVGAHVAGADVPEHRGDATQKDDPGAAIPERQASAARSEDAGHIGTWTVTDWHVAIRSAPDRSSEKLGSREEGDTVRGRAEGGWLKLDDDAGYMQIIANDTILLQKQEAAIEKENNDELACGEAYFFVDNRELRAITAGLAYRTAAEWEKRDPDGGYATWGSTVRGVQLHREGNDWLKVEERYLPMRVNGKCVLRAVGERARAGTCPSPSMAPAAKAADEPEDPYCHAARDEPGQRRLQAARLRRCSSEFAVRSPGQESDDVARESLRTPQGPLHPDVARENAPPSRGRSPPVPAPGTPRSPTAPPPPKFRHSGRSPRPEQRTQPDLRRYRPPSPRRGTDARRQ